MDFKNCQIGFNSVVAACSSAGWDQVDEIFFSKSMGFLHAFPKVNGNKLNMSSSNTAATLWV